MRQFETPVEMRAWAKENGITKIISPFPCPWCGETMKPWYSCSNRLVCAPCLSTRRSNPEWRSKNWVKDREREAKYRQAERAKRPPRSSPALNPIKQIKKRIKELDARVRAHYKRTLVPWGKLRLILKDAGIGKVVRKAECKTCKKTGVEWYTSLSKTLECAKCHNKRMWLKYREKRKARQTAWKKANPEKCRNWLKQWKARNPDKAREIRRRTEKRQRRDPKHRIVRNLRRRLRDVVKGERGGKNITGCSREFLVKHLESQFQCGMGWSNYGVVWHIDHKIPLAAFNLENQDEVKRATHWTNLQPMFAEENIQKGAQFSEEQQELLLTIGS